MNEIILIMLPTIITMTLLMAYHWRTKRKIEVAAKVGVVAIQIPSWGRLLDEGQLLVFLRSNYRGDHEEQPAFFYINDGDGLRAQPINFEQIQPDFYHDREPIIAEAIF